MNYWKQFKLSKMAKARVIEIFHASRLWYAAKFYPIPLDIQKELQRSFANYINFPAKAPTVTQQELFKLRKHGGIKLIHIHTKSTAPKIKWLIEMTTNTKLTHHLNTMTRLMQHQPAGLDGTDLIFTTNLFVKKKMTKNSKFYSEAMMAITTLDTKKKILDPREENIFYNKIFLTNGRPIVPNETTRRYGLNNYGQLLDEVQKRENQLIIYLTDYFVLKLERIAIVLNNNCIIFSKQIYCFISPNYLKN